MGDLKESFSDIMKYYRHQPQAKSSTYRQVLISVDANGQGNTFISIRYNIYIKLNACFQKNMVTLYTFITTFM